MLLNHGLDKLNHFSVAAPGFPDPPGVGHTTSLALAVFTEVVASALLVAGLVTRFGAVVLVINMSAAFFIAHKAV